MDVLFVLRLLVGVFLLNNVVEGAKKQPNQKESLFQLKIIHTNDFHCYFDGIAKYGQLCKESEPENCFGGITRLQYLAKKMKNETNTIFLNAGDHFQGSAYYKLFKWGIVANLTKPLPIDVMSLGNHEFDDGPKDLAKFLKFVKIPCVCANIDLSKEPELDALINKSVILNVGGKRIGVVGYMAKETPTLSSPGVNITFTDEITAIRKEARRLKESNLTDIIIALGHSGYAKDLEIAQKIRHVDVVVGGHSHTFLYTGSPPIPNWPPVEGPYPTWVKQNTSGNSSKQAPVVQAYAYGAFLGSLNLTFNNRTNRLLNATGNPILINHTLPEDPDMKEKFGYYKEKFDKLVNITIGHTSLHLEGGDICRERECSGGNFFSDLILLHTLNATLKMKPADSWALSSIVYLGAGTIRLAMGPGPITVRDVFTAFPFQSIIKVANITGENLWQGLEVGVSRCAPGVRPGSFPQLSGIHVKYNLSQPANSRVMEASVRCQKCLVPTYEPLNRSAVYTFITYDYLLKGGDGYGVFKNATILYESEIISEVIVEAFQFGTYFTEVGDRVVLFGNATAKS